MQYLVCAVIFLGADSSTDWQVRLAEVESNYDVTMARQLVEQLRTEAGAEAALAEALLVLAELHRIDFEALDESDRPGRRDLGSQIDALADEALLAIEPLAESSLKQRLTADVFGVKIRSNFQAKKYRKQMERAAAQAIELDPTNAAAYVSAAKPYIFADERHRGDVDHAIALLETALTNDPELEKAHLLLAYAFEVKEDLEHAVQIYESVLQSNPNCRPAHDGLERLKTSKDNDLRER